MLINLTPHVIRVATKSKRELAFWPDGRVARIKMTTKHWDWVTTPGVLVCPTCTGAVQCNLCTGGPRSENPDNFIVEIHTALYGGIEDLPEPQEGTTYIVSKMVADMSTRQDIVYPDTGSSAIRDEQGRIVSVRRFLR